jgi:HTH-type transcriptional regulator, sugar sensing transcriptional regulator
LAKLAVTDSAVPDEVLAGLRRLGFTDYEARIYVRLLQQDRPSTAYEVAKTTGVPRPNAYAALETLAQRGAVLPVSAAPARYVAAPPGDFLDGVARQTRTLCAEVGERLAAMAAASDAQWVYSLDGEAEVNARIDQLIHETRETLLIKAPDDLLRRHKPALAEAGARGVDMLIVVFGPDAAEFTLRPALPHLHPRGQRRAHGQHRQPVHHCLRPCGDGHGPHGGEVVAVHTRNGPIVNMAESLIRHDFYMAEIFARFGPQIDAAFGPYLRDLRLACFTPEQAESFKLKTGLGPAEPCAHPPFQMPHNGQRRGHGRDLVVDRQARGPRLLASVAADLVQLGRAVAAQGQRQMGDAWPRAQPVLDHREQVADGVDAAPPDEGREVEVQGDGVGPRVRNTWSRISPAMKPSFSCNVRTGVSMGFSTLVPGGRPMASSASSAAPVKGRPPARFRRKRRCRARWSRRRCRTARPAGSASRAQREVAAPAARR